ncbi:MAG: hypothetical protein LBU51_03095 [Bacteroidales bacterium]|jgi:hypothetical protein|nr:hypothetical protein [Bacteroidales bacterium]
MPLTIEKATIIVRKIQETFRNNDNLVPVQGFNKKPNQVECWCREDDEGLHFVVRYKLRDDSWLFCWPIPLNKTKASTRGFFEEKRDRLLRETSFKDNHQFPPIKGNGTTKRYELDISVNQSQSENDLINDIIDIYMVSSKILEYRSKKTYPKV